MAEQLVASMTGDFSADAYRDDYRQALMAVIERKVAGEQPEPAQREAPTNIGDLMAALEASVAAARESRAQPAAEAASQAEPEALTAAPPRRRRKTA
jgi:DNA end-binding protein Ku